MKKSCLLLMPFSDANGDRASDWEAFSRVLSSRIEEVLPEYSCDRAFVGAGPILNLLIQKIVGSDLIVCDLTHLKPNVIFELGISMLLGKPIILLVKGSQPLPSDFGNIAYISYATVGSKVQPLFPANGGEDLFTSALRRAAHKPRAEHFSCPDSSLTRTLSSIANVLKRALQLESGDSDLAPVFRSLLESLTFGSAATLARFLENDRESVQIKLDVPAMLFNVLVSLLKNLNSNDRYDSITWRKHWVGENQYAARFFIEQIHAQDADLPVMRRVFLIGVVGRRATGDWNIDSEDRKALGAYNQMLGAAARVSTHFLFLPKPLLEPVADHCHMGKTTRGDSSLFVFSRYSDTGSLDSFVISRGRDLPWTFEEVWELSQPVVALSGRGAVAASVAGKYLAFHGSPQRILYRRRLRSFLDRLGIAPVASL